MRIKPLLPLLAAVGLFTAVNAQAVILIDNFDTNLQTTATFSNHSDLNAVDPSPSGSVFSEREQLAILNGPSFNAADRAGIDTSSGLSTFFGNAVDEVFLRTTWRTPVGGPLDFTGEDTLRLDVFENTPGSNQVDYFVEVFTDGTGGALSALKEFQLIDGPSIIDLALFDGQWLDGITNNPVNLDWDAVVAIELQAQTPSGQTASFEAFFSSVSVVSTAAVPTPGSVLLMSLGLVGVAAVKRRKRA